jgi:hypothetical protein
MINSAGMPISTHFPICTKKLMELNIGNASEMLSKMRFQEHSNAKDTFRCFYCKRR